ncbi:hypothetical protein AB0H86_06215 [Streptomyces sp. NPDC050997]|uniref:hypothetical protein n=1 Tax=Streptomyces sp. NPDC050997 TaxID=3155519 RepID=UPI00341A666E
MALLALDIVKGLITLGTSMDFESPRSRDLGCWDGVEFNTPLVDALADPVGEDWVVPDQLVDEVFNTALGGVSGEEREFWLASGDHRGRAALPERLEPGGGRLRGDRFREALGLS